MKVLIKSQKFRRIMIKKNLSENVLAEKLGISPQYISLLLTFVIDRQALAVSKN